MLIKIRDFWRDWWPLISGVPVAVYAIVAYFARAQSDMFLLAKLFRWELLICLLILGVFSLIHLKTPEQSRVRPRNASRRASSVMRLALRPETPLVGRIPGMALILSLLILCAAFAFYVQQTYSFMVTRYTHLDRQELVAKAGRAEKAQNMPLAISLYEQTVHDFPYSRFNTDVNSKISQLKERQRSWELSYNEVRSFDARWPDGKASTRFDRLANACRFLSNAFPCTKTNEYLGLVDELLAKAEAPTATCSTIFARTRPADFWVLMDPNDRHWLGLQNANATDICRSLGLRTHEDVASYLRARWHVDALESSSDDGQTEASLSE